MELYVVIALAALVVLGVVAAALVGVFGLGAFVAIRRRKPSAPPGPSAMPEAPRPHPSPPTDRPAPVAPIAAAPSATPVPAPVPGLRSPRPPPLPSSFGGAGHDLQPGIRGAAGFGDPGLIGMFDDPVAKDAAKTELFQRGANAFGFEPRDDEDEPEEGEATEIFSAHGPAGDLAGFLETPGQRGDRK